MPITPKASLVGIHLKWDDQNGFEDGFRIYRSPYPFDEEDLPEMLVELPPNTTEYIDEDVIIGIEYFYRISTFYGAHEVFASNQFSALAKAGPDTIGEYYQGGYYIGNIEIPDGFYEGTYAVIMAPQEADVSLQWKTSNSGTAGTSSDVDGMANTLAMTETEALALAHPAAAYCRDYSGDNFNDWYMPARNELLIAWDNRADLAALNMGMNTTYVWSSTQHPSSASNAWSRRFSSATENTILKSSVFRVRPVRRLKLMI